MWLAFFIKVSLVHADESRERKFSGKRERGKKRSMRVAGMKEGATRGKPEVKRENAARSKSNAKRDKSGEPSWPDDAEK